MVALQYRRRAAAVRDQSLSAAAAAVRLYLHRLRAGGSAERRLACAAITLWPRMHGASKPAGAGGGDTLCLSGAAPKRRGLALGFVPWPLSFQHSGDRDWLAFAAWLPDRAAGGARARQRRCGVGACAAGTQR